MMRNRNYLLASLGIIFLSLNFAYSAEVLSLGISTDHQNNSKNACYRKGPGLEAKCSNTAALITAVTRFYTDTGYAIRQISGENPPLRSINISSTCRSHLTHMVLSHKNLEPWAMQMFLSFGKLPNGLLRGETYALGDFDSCLSVSSPSNFKGQYCSVGVLANYYELIEMVEYLYPNGYPHSAIQRMMEYYKNSTRDLSLYRKVDINTFRTSICIPSTCTRGDVDLIASTILDIVGLEKWTPIVTTCKVQESTRLDSVEISLLGILAFMVLLVIIGTSTELYFKYKTDTQAYRTQSGLGIKLLLCFSVYSNTTRLITPPEGNMNMLDIVKSVALLGVIQGHSLMAHVGTKALVSDMDFWDLTKEDISFQANTHGLYGIEMFFFITAVFVTYSAMRNPRRGVVSLFIARIWRLTPAFMLVMAFGLLVHHLGSGPLWDENMRFFITKCRTSWWRNMLYINNYDRLDEMCMVWYWYLAAEMQLFIYILVVIYLLRRFPKRRILILALSLALTITVSTAAAAMYPPVPNGSVAFIMFGYPSTAFSDFLASANYPSYNHAISTAMGMAVGYLIWINPRIRLSLQTYVAGWLLAISVTATLVLSGYEWCQGNNFPSFSVNLIYVSASKIMWPSLLTWGVISCMSRGGNVIQKVPNYTAMVLARLGYMAYLLHPIFYIMYFGSTRSLIKADRKSEFVLFCAIAVFSYSMAYVFNMCFEMPFLAMDRIIFGGREKSARVIDDQIKEAELNEFAANTCIPHDKLEGIAFHTIQTVSTDVALSNKGTTQ